MNRMGRLWLMISMAMPLCGFSTLDEALVYAQKMPEEPAVDRMVWRDPDYTTFLEYQYPAFFSVQGVRQYLGLRYDPAWTYKNWHDLLKTLTARVQQQEADRPRIASLRVPEGTRVIIFGDLFGAFHSLIRDLKHLKDQKIIDNNLRIVRDDVYIVFVGNIVGRSPYSLPTSFLVLRLLERNPERVVYLRGEQETDNYWKDFSLADELVMAVPESEYKPLLKDVSQFFETLPIALYITTPGSPGRVIRISSFGRENYSLDEEKFGDFTFDRQPSGLTYLAQPAEARSTYPPEVTVIIRGQQKLQELRTISGLDFIEPDFGAGAWSAFSSPTQVNQQYIKFFADAYSELVIRQPMSMSTIQRISRDIRIKGPFERSPLYNAVTGQKIFDEAVYLDGLLHPIQVGSVMPLSRGSQVLARALQQGISAAIIDQNAEGGVHGIPIILTVEDDEGVPSYSRFYIEQLVRTGVDIILMPFGTQNLLASLDYIVANKIFAIFPSGPTEALRHSGYRSIIFMRPSIEEEGRILTEYMIKRHTMQRLALLYRNDTYGRALFEGAQRALKSHPEIELLSLPYYGSADEAKKVREFQPDTIGLLVLADPARQFLHELGAASLSGKKIFAASSVTTTLFKEFAHDYGFTVIGIQAVPDPFVSQLEIVKEYRAAMDRRKVPYATKSLEGYMGTSIMLEMMKKIEGPVTKEKLIEQFESINNLDFKGLELNFDAAERNIMSCMWIQDAAYSSEWIKVNIVPQGPLTLDEKDIVRQSLDR